MSTNRKSVNEEQKPKQRVTGTMSQFENKLAEPFTPENTAIVMIDFSVEFANIFRSHTINENIRAAIALAKTALGFHTDLVVNLGKGQQIYPELAKVLGDHQIIYRGGEYNALDNRDVSEAVEKTGCSRVAIAGLTTEDCTSTNVI